MRKTIEIDPVLIDIVLEAAGLSTKQTAVDVALQRLLRQRAIMEMAGLGWEGDLATMRDGRG